MRIRTNILPQALSDIGGFGLIVTCIPLTAIFLLFFILPIVYEVGSVRYVIAFALGLFLLFNLKLNMMAVMMMNTSIQGQILNPPENDEGRMLWRLCTSCETLCPPRSWHCKICKTCILKRDHHCIFTGCCIGYHNHRYFFMFLVYFCVGTLYTIVHTIYYFWIAEIDIFSGFILVLQLFCPALFLPYIGVDRNNVCLLIFELNVLGFFYSLVVLYSQIIIIIKGGVTWELCKGKTKYNLGLMKNLEIVLGKRKHLVWLSPFIQSELPMDGIHWEDIIEDSTKNK